MMQNLKWDQNTMPSEILRQIRAQVQQSEDETLNNLYALSFAVGKAEALEYLHAKHSIERKTADPKKG